MKRYADYIKGLLIGSLVGLFIGLALASLATVFAVFAWRAWYPIPNPALPPKGAATSPAASPEELTARVENLENDQAYNLRNFEWQLDQKILVLGGVALVISVITGFMGFKSYKDLDGLIREKIRATLENELYQLDPVNLTVRVPKLHPDREEILKRLQAAGLKNIKEYTELSDVCKAGLTIVPVENDEMAKDYRDLLDRTIPGENDAAFVLYVTNQYRISQNTINKHTRAATANMPSTVVTAILAISRGLHKDRQKEEVQ